MPYATNQGIRIHYEVEGQGPALVLQYGQYFPLDIWYELNYVTTLKKDYRLILIDSRGQGDSDKPHDPNAYRVKFLVNDITAVLDDLDVQKAHYMGYSSGGLVGFGVARFAPQRFHSLMIGGMHPYDDSAGHSIWSQAQIQHLQTQTSADFVAGMESFLMSINLPAFSPQMKSRMLTHDVQALMAWARQYAEWPGFEIVLSAITLPCLLYAGENDWSYAQVQKAAQEMPDATFVSIPNGQHNEDGTWVSILAPHIKALVTRATSI
jgi:pimeloyl-ACP methyl ester carboxylesterase